MLTFNSELRIALAGVANKTLWGAKLNEMLGNVRRVRCFRDNNAGAANAYITGTEFLNIGNTGPLLTKAGTITSFGQLGGVTVRQAADLTTGTCVLRIEGNGHWVQGTLGKADRNTDTDKLNDVDFTLNANPTASSGFSMAASMEPPRLLPSGTGPLAPPTDLMRPVVLELLNCKDEANPVVVGSLTLNVRANDWVFQDVELAAEMGDIRVTQSNESIVYDGFEFGAVLLSMNPQINSETADVVHELLVSCKPYDRWPTYPAMDSYNEHTVKNIVYAGRPSPPGFSANISQPGSVLEKITVVAKADGRTFTVTSSVRGLLGEHLSGEKDAEGKYAKSFVNGPLSLYISDPGVTPFNVGDKWTFDIVKTFDQTKDSDSTFPSPFKINVRRLDNSILYTYQMRDGLPINSPKLAQVRRELEGMRPFFNCGMVLPWRSHRQKLNSRALKYVPPATPDSWRPSQAHWEYSYNGAVPMLAGRTQVNSINHYFNAPQWPVGWGDQASNDALAPQNDAYGFNVKQYYTASSGPGRSIARAIGWDYEPGSISLHDWYTGPGGPRIDRAVIASPIIMYLNNPTGRRAQDNSLLKDNCEAWMKAYFNHSCHYVRDVKTWDTLPVEEVSRGKWSYSRQYYGGTDNYVAGGLSRHVSQWAIPNGAGSGGKQDKDGRMVWNGYAVDHLHCYAQPGYGTLLFNSPMYAIIGKHKYIQTMMTQLLAVSLTSHGGWYTRQGAWRQLNYAMAWKLASKHPMGVDRALVEERWQYDIEAAHKAFYVPTHDVTHPEYNSIDSQMLRNLGCVNMGGPEEKNVLKTPEVKDAEGVVITPATYDAMHAWQVGSNGLTFYITQVFMLMKTTGSWDVMLNKSQKCREMLEFFIECIDKFTVDFILDCKGRAEGGYPWAGVPTLQTQQPGPVATSWANWAEIFPPKHPLEDWVHGSDGQIISERDVGQHNRAMWVWIREYYFPEYPNARLLAAKDAYQAHYDAKAASVAAIVGSTGKRNGDWGYRIPAFFLPQKPAVT